MKVSAARAAARQGGLGAEASDDRDAAGQGERQKSESEQLAHGSLMKVSAVAIGATPRDGGRNVQGRDDGDAAGQSERQKSEGEQFAHQSLRGGIQQLPFGQPARAGAAVIVVTTATPPARTRAIRARARSFFMVVAPIGGVFSTPGRRNPPAPDAG